MDGHVGQSLDYVQIALRKGFTNRELLEEHEYLARVRRDPRFRQMLGQLLD
jgi:hypothetical protein